MILWKSAVVLVACLAAPLASPAQMRLRYECGTTVCGGVPTCTAGDRCVLGCELVLVSTPYGVGATCACKDTGRDSCCDLVIIPGGETGQTYRPIGICTDFGVDGCPHFGPCRMWVDSSGALHPLCLPPPPPPGGH